MIDYNKVFEDFISSHTKDEFCSYCDTHTKQEIMEHFSIQYKSTFKRVIEYYSYDLKSRNPMKGRKSNCSHEDYVLRGKKSANTQKNTWESKTEREKLEWSEKQKLAHSTDEFKKKIRDINKQYLESLSQEEKDLLNKRRSESVKKWWRELTDEQKSAEIKKHFDGGAGWNYDKIHSTIVSKYNVDNISQLEHIKEISKQSSLKTCREKYGVDYNCLLPQCSIGSRGSDTAPNIKFSKLLEEAFSDYVGEFGIDREITVGKYRYDFKVGNTLIEINPSATHNSTWGVYSKEGVDKLYHLNKLLTAESLGYRCVHIFDWDDEEKVVSLLSKKETVYARKCEIRFVDRLTAVDYINKYHLQGYAKDEIRIGLYYKDELVSIMTFGKSRYNKKYKWELIRYCSSKNVVGGSSKLFKYFLDNYDGSIISYCDRSKFRGDTYIKLGFTLIRENKTSKHWYNIKTKKHITDNLLRQRGFDQIFGTNYGKGSSNEQLMIENGFVEIYDCGQSTYILNR